MIFRDEGDYGMFLDFMRKYQEQYGIKIFAFCLMPKHFHLLVEIEKSRQMSEFMHSLNNNYTKYFNSRYDRKGHLFRGRYKAALIEKEPYLLKMTAYLHLNPQKIGLVEDPAGYDKSSYQLYLYNDKAQAQDFGFLRSAINEALDLLGNRSYTEFIKGFSQDDAEAIHKKLQRGGILGSDAFVRMVKSEVEASQAAQGEARKADVKAKDSNRLYYLMVGAVLFLMAGFGRIYFIYGKKQAVTPHNAAMPAPVINKLDKLKFSEWQISITGGNEVMADTLTFLDGKFISAWMNAQGYPQTNYSVVVDGDDKVIWETMQTLDTSIVSWRGEVVKGKMNGVISLRQDGQEPRDFSFSSIASKRKGK
jgi:REP element-mobilizing transposase RayT